MRCHRQQRHFFELNGQNLRFYEDESKSGSGLGAIDMADCSSVQGSVAPMSGAEEMEIVTSEVIHTRPTVPQRSARFASRRLPCFVCLIGNTAHLPHQMRRPGGAAGLDCPAERGQEALNRTEPHGLVEGSSLKDRC